MTVKEIAAAVGKDVTTVQRWLKKLSGKMQSVNSKMQSSSPMHPATYTQDEVLAIIEEGMGAEAAGVYRANTEAKPSNAKPELPNGTQLREIRLIFGDMAKDFLLRHMGFEQQIYYTSVKLGRISPQAYAVEMKYREKQRLLLEQKRDQGELF